MPPRRRASSKKKKRAKSSSKKDSDELRKLFDSIDEDGSGTIDEDELIEGAGILGFGNLTPNDINDLLTEADTNGDGFIDFNEFVAIVTGARFTSSKWKKSSMLTQTRKRFNQVVADSEALFSSIHALTKANSYQTEEGRKIPSCMRFWSYLCGMFVPFVVGGLLSISLAAVGMESVGAMVFTTVVPFLIFGLSLIAWNRSQAHIGHLMFGMKVIHYETGEDVGLGMLLLRNLLTPLMLVDIYFILCSADARSLRDFMLGQQVIVTDKKFAKIRNATIHAKKSSRPNCCLSW